MNQQSPCVEKPNVLYMSLKAVYANTTDYSLVANKVNLLLDKLSKQEEDGLTYSYVEEAQTWKVKYVNLDGIMHMHINCYWDTAAQDHLLDIRRVGGHNQQVNHGGNLVQKFKKHFAKQDDPVSPKRVSKGRMSVLPFPQDTSDIQYVQPLSQQVLVWDTLNLYKVMAENEFYETRMCCLDGICTLLRKCKTDVELKNTLSNSRCLDVLNHIVNTLMKDMFDDVRELASCAAKHLPEPLEEMVY